MEQLYLIPNFIKNRGVIMKNREHYFHTEEQMYFSDNWFSKFIKNE